MPHFLRCDSTSAQNDRTIGKVDRKTTDGYHQEGFESDKWNAQGCSGSKEVAQTDSTSCVLRI